MGAIQGAQRENHALQSPHHRYRGRSVSSHLAVIDQVQDSLDQVGGLSLLGPGECHTHIMPEYPRGDTGYMSDEPATENTTNRAVENAAIEYVLAYEREQGRKAWDTRGHGAAADLESDDGRLIEVKAYGRSARGTRPLVGDTPGR